MAVEEKEEGKDEDEDLFVRRLTASGMGPLDSGYELHAYQSYLCAMFVLTVGALFIFFKKKTSKERNRFSSLSIFPPVYFIRLHILSFPSSSYALVIGNSPALIIGRVFFRDLDQPISNVSKYKLIPCSISAV